MKEYAHPEPGKERQFGNTLSNTDGGGPNNGLGIPLTNARMKQQASFVGWDFKNTWTICAGKDYPRLRWEKVDCDQQ